MVGASWVATSVKVTLGSCPLAFVESEHTPRELAPCSSDSPTAAAVRDRSPGTLGVAPAATADDRTSVDARAKTRAPVEAGSPRVDKTGMPGAGPRRRRDLGGVRRPKPTAQPACSAPGRNGFLPRAAAAGIEW